MQELSKHETIPSTGRILVRDKPFQSAVYKILNQHECEMNEIKRNEVKSLVMDRVSIDDQCSDGLSYFTQIQSKRRKLSSASSSYIDCLFVSATTRLV